MIRISKVEGSCEIKRCWRNNPIGVEEEICEDADQTDDSQRDREYEYSEQPLIESRGVGFGFLFAEEATQSETV